MNWLRRIFGKPSQVEVTSPEKIAYPHLQQSTTWRYSLYLKDSYKIHNVTFNNTTGINYIKWNYDRNQPECVVIVDHENEETEMTVFIEDLNCPYNCGVQSQTYKLKDI